jgi:hypothetical protein
MTVPGVVPPTNPATNPAVRITHPVPRWIMANYV